MLTRRVAGRRSGFALMIAIVSIAVMAVLATVIFASLSGGGAGVSRVALATDILFRFKTEIIGAPPSFYERIRVYPGHLHDLVEPITTSDSSLCGTPYRASPDVNNWLGPYHLIPFNQNFGYTLAAGIVAQNTLERGNLLNGTLALAIVMDVVNLADAQEMDVRIDGAPGPNADTITYVPNGDNPVIVKYLMPIVNTC